MKRRKRTYRKSRQTKGDLNIEFIQEIVLALLFAIICISIITGMDLNQAVAWLIALINKLIASLFMMHDPDYQIAKGSSMALSCALDTTAKYDGVLTPPEDDIASGNINLFEGITTCKYGKEHRFKTDDFYDVCKDSSFECSISQSLCFGDANHACTVCSLSTDATPEIVCKVAGFELPQDIYRKKYKPLDFGMRWIGATGQPKYIVYYETFPEYAEASWTYKGTDAVMHAFAIGAVTNIGIGGVKVVKSGIVNGVKYAFAHGSMKEVKQKIYSDRVKRDMIKNFGGKRAERIFTISLLGKDLVGDETTEIMYKHSQYRIYNQIVNSPNKDTWIKYIGDDFKKIGALADADTLVTRMQPYTATRESMSDVTGYVIGRSGGDLTETDIKLMIIRQKPHLAMSSSEIKTITNEMNDMRQLVRTQKLLNKPTREALRKELVADGGKYYKEFYKDLEYNLKKSYGKHGIKPSIRDLNIPFIISRKARLTNEIDKSSEHIYHAWMMELWNEGGDVKYMTNIAGKTLPSNWHIAQSKKVNYADLYASATDETLSPAQMKLNAYMVSWNNVPIDSSAKKEIWLRSEQLVRGMGVAPYNGYPSKLRVAVMASALGASYMAMQMDSKAEKYEICDQNSVCLAGIKHWFTIGNDPEQKSYESFQLDNTDNKWVELDIPQVLNSKGFPLALVSPCKTNLDIEATECGCKVFCDSDEVCIVFRRYIAYDVRDRKTHEITHHDTEDTKSMKYVKLPCKSAPCEYGLTAYTGSVDDYIGDGSADAPLQKDIDFLLTTQFATEYDPNHGWELGDPNIELRLDGNRQYKYLHTQYEILNMRNQQIKDKDNPFGESVMMTRTYKKCIKYGAWDISKYWTDEETPSCMKVTVSSKSMQHYKETTKYTSNFCRDNKNQLEDKASIAIDGGLMLGGVALMLFPPTSVAGGATVMAVSGLAGGLGTATQVWWDITDRWAEDQSK